MPHVQAVTVDSFQFEFKLFPVAHYNKLWVGQWYGVCLLSPVPAWVLLWVLPPAVQREAHSVNWQL